MSDFVPGEFYRCVPNRQFAQIKKGEYYEFIRLSKSLPTHGYFRLPSGKEVAYNLMNFEKTPVSKRNEVAFIAGLFYKAKDIFYDSITKDKYYLVVRVGEVKLEVVQNDGRNNTYIKQFFDSNTGRVSIDGDNNVKENQNIPKSRDSNVMINKDFTVKLAPLEDVREYKTPGLFVCTDSQESYTILAVSYNPKDDHLLGFVVDSNDETHQIKEWSTSWDARSFEPTKGVLTLTFK